ncbi:MFS transporter [Candidatus Poribacteria bacterium]|nr:MFS transporter [Candidatus Poribacteria bacterium]
MIGIFSVVGLTFPMFPLYFQSAGLSKSQIAVLMSMPGVAGLAAFQLWGYMADVLYNRRTVLAGTSAVAALTALGFPVVAGFWAFLILTALNALFSDPRVPIYNAMVLANHCGESSFARIRITGSLSFIVTVLVVGWIADRPGGPGAGVIFPLLVAVNLLVIPSLFFVADQPVGHGRKRAGPSGPGFWQVQRILLAKPVLRAFLLFVLVFQLPHNISMLFQSVLVKDLGGSTTDAMGAFAVAAGVEILVFFFGSWLLDHVRLMWLFFVAVAAQVLRWALICAVTTIPSIYLSNTLHAFTFGVMYLCAVVFVNREVPPEYRSSGQSLLAIVYVCFGNLAGPLLSAAFLYQFPVRWWYGVAAAISLLAIPLWWRTKRLYDEEHGGEITRIVERPLLALPD